MQRQGADLDTGDIRIEVAKFENPSDRLNHGYIEPVFEIVKWAAVASAGGVVGNAAYDLLKVGVRSIHHRLKHEGPVVATAEWRCPRGVILQMDLRDTLLMNALAKLAVTSQAYARGSGIQFSADDLRVSDWYLAEIEGRRVYESMVRHRDSTFQARVRIPVEDLSDNQAEVLIHAIEESTNAP